MKTVWIEIELTAALFGIVAILWCLNKISKHIENGLDDIKQSHKLTEKIIMAKLEDLVNALDAETNAVATRIDALKTDLVNAIAAGQPPSGDTLNKLTAISDRLKSLGANPNDPIPPPVATT